MDEAASTRKYFCITFLVIIIFGVGIFYATKYFMSEKGGKAVFSSCGEDTTAEFVNLPILGDFVGDYPWWNNNFSYFQQIAVSNKNNAQIAKKCWVSFTFDHAYLVEEQKSLPDGADLKILHYNGNKYKQIPFTLNTIDTEDTKIEFELATDVAKKSTEYSYFLYYGNPTAGDNTSIISNVEKDREFTKNVTMSLGDEVQPKVKGNLSRKWIIKGIEDFTSSELIYTVELDDSIENSKPPTFKVIGTSLSGSTDKVFRNEYEATIDASDLKPGTYYLQASVKTKDETYKSTKIPFFISYPLFVVLSVDWEGVNAENSQLDELIAFSDKHNDLPITHFFNPRIYTTSEVTEEQADYLTQWIQVRRVNGDEIGMHLHMHLDMVEAAGVTPRTNPKWTTNLTNGHDVPSSAYSYKEFSKILEWALNTFEEEGLGIPISYRAGGWFANMDVLQAVNDAGFKVDSSGRDYYIWGANKIPGYWKLSSTTYPYHPSTANQNASTPEPTLALWEFPNNGSDSYFHSAEELKSRFNDNFKKVALTRPQTLTYLTHSHEFTSDVAILDPVYKYVGKYLAESDRGPVIYATLEDTYEYWEELY